MTVFRHFSRVLSDSACLAAGEDWRFFRHLARVRIAPSSFLVGEHGVEQRAIPREAGAGVHEFAC